MINSIRFLGFYSEVSRPSRLLVYLIEWGKNEQNYIPIYHYCHPKRFYRSNRAN